MRAARCVMRRRMSTYHVTPRNPPTVGFELHGTCIRNGCSLMQGVFQPQMYTLDSAVLLRAPKSLSAPLTSIHRNGAIISQASRRIAEMQCNECSKCIGMGNHQDGFYVSGIHVYRSGGRPSLRRMPCHAICACPSRKGVMTLTRS